LNLGDAATVSFFASEPRCDKRTHDIERELDSNHTRAETQHIAIVMFARLMSGIRVTAERGANAEELISGDSRAHTTPADQYSNLSGAVLHGLADLFGVIRIIVRDGAVVRAEVDQIMTTMPQLFNHPFIQRITRMISSNRDPHFVLFVPFCG
jgi:hypothetical protein